MSRFFKSAAFPILIVVVLAFFAQKLIGSSSHQPHYTYGNLIQQLESHRIRSLSVHESDNIVNATTTGGVHYTVGYADPAPLLTSIQKDVNEGGLPASVPDSAGCLCVTAMFSVGKPIVRPSFLPWITWPVIEYG